MASSHIPSMTSDATVCTDTSRVIEHLLPRSAHAPVAALALALLDSYTETWLTGSIWTHTLNNIPSLQLIEAFQRFQKHLMVWLNISRLTQVLGVMEMSAKQDGSGKMEEILVHKRDYKPAGSLLDNLAMPLWSSNFQWFTKITKRLILLEFL